jgi:hypothetical protein
MWWENKDRTVLQRKSTKEKKNESGSTFKFDEKLTMRAFYSISQQKRGRMKVGRHSNMMKNNDRRVYSVIQQKKRTMEVAHQSDMMRK